VGEEIEFKNNDSTATVQFASTDGDVRGDLFSSGIIGPYKSESFR
jgi:hypothetical protein